MGVHKSLAFGLSALLHLGLLCILGTILIKPAVTNRIMEIDLTPWALTALSSKGKITRQSEQKKVSENTQKKRPPPVVHLTTSAKKEMPKPEHRTVASVSADHTAKTSTAVVNAAEEKSSVQAERRQTPTTVGGGSGRLPGRSYFAAVLARIEAAKQYPPSAVRRHIEGNAVVTFCLSPDGRLLLNHLKRSSGYSMLDNAALAAVHDAAPFPGFTNTSNTLPRALSVTISFVLTP